MRGVFQNKSRIAERDFIVEQMRVYIAPLERRALVGIARGPGDFPTAFFHQGVAEIIAGIAVAKAKELVLVLHSSFYSLFLSRLFFDAKNLHPRSDRPGKNPGSDHRAAA